MNSKKVLIANLYIAGTVIMVIGFIWMGALAAVASDYNQILASFFFTISGVIFWSLANWYRIKQEQLKKKELMKKYLEKVQIEHAVAQHRRLHEANRTIPHGSS